MRVFESKVRILESRDKRNFGRKAQTQDFSEDLESKGKSIRLISESYWLSWLKKKIKKRF